MTIDQRMEDIKTTLGKVSPYSNTRLLVHLIPLVEEIERLRMRGWAQKNVPDVPMTTGDVHE